MNRPGDLSHHGFFLDMQARLFVRIDDQESLRDDGSLIPEANIVRCEWAHKIDYEKNTRNAVENVEAERADHDRCQRALHDLVGE